MSVQFSPVVDAQPRNIPGFNKLMFVDLVSLGVHASPLAVLDDFHVAELPFSAHPHAGFAAVTYVFEDSIGAVRSRTSTGADIVMGAGGIIWTQAGRGVIHEEIPAQRGQELHGLQLFVNVTSQHKSDTPRIMVLEGKDVPAWRSADGDVVRVVVGTFGDVSSPLQPDEPFTMLDVTLQARISVPLTAAQNTVFYVLDGTLTIGAEGEARQVRGGQALALTQGTAIVSVEATSPAHLLVLAGLAIDEPIVEEGPFIMNDRSQIQAAIARFRSGEMGTLTPR